MSPPHAVRREGGCPAGRARGCGPRQGPERGRVCYSAGGRLSVSPVQRPAFRVPAPRYLQRQVSRNATDIDALHVKLADLFELQDLTE